MYPSLSEKTAENISPGTEQPYLLTLIQRLEQAASLYEHCNNLLRSKILDLYKESDDLKGQIPGDNPPGAASAIGNLYNLCNRFEGCNFEFQESIRKLEKIV